MLWPGDFNDHLQKSNGHSTSDPYFASRSKIKNRAGDPNGKASRSC